MHIHGLLCIVFRSIKHGTLTEFAVMQHLFAVYDLVVVHIDHSSFVRIIYRIVIKEFGADKGASLQLSFQLWIFLHQQFFVPKLRVE